VVLWLSKLCWVWVELLR